MSGSKKNEEALMVPPCDAKSSQKEYFQLVENWQRNKLLEICVNKTLIHYNPTYFKYNPVNPESLEFHSTKYNK